MFKVGDKVVFVQVSKFQKEFARKIGIIDKVKSVGKYRNHVRFKNDNLNKEAEHLWWEDANLKLLEISDEEYLNMLDEIDEATSEKYQYEYENDMAYNNTDKYGFKYIDYTRIIANITLFLTCVIGFILLVSSLYNNGIGFVACILEIFGGFVTYVLLLLFTSMAENLAYIRKNSEKDDR
jgi:hypothetical protein